MNWTPMAPNVKELERKIAVLERNNKALTDRLARTEHKVSALFQWALSFPALAASQNIMKVSKRPGQGVQNRSGGQKRRASSTATRNAKAYKRENRVKIESTVIEMVPGDDEDHVTRVEVIPDGDDDAKHLESLEPCPSDNVQREEIYAEADVEGGYTLVRGHVATLTTKME